jgi:hypothetical protein
VKPEVRHRVVAAVRRSLDDRKTAAPDGRKGRGDVDGERDAGAGLVETGAGLLERGYLPQSFFHCSW